MDITKLSITELKALKCDVYEQLNLNQQNLQVINAELQKRAQAEAEAVDKENKSKEIEKKVK